MDQRAQRVSAPIMLMPPEIVSHVLGIVSDRDFCAARKAHRVFWVTSDRAIERRRERLWLRTSPERACAAGRTDIVEFLWRRKRIPRTFDMWQAAFVTPDPVIIEIAREQDSSKAKLGSVRDMALRKDAPRLFFQLFDTWDVTIDDAIDAAICSCASRILEALLGVATRVRPRYWARQAAERGHVGGLGILLDRYPWVPLGSVVDTAVTHMRNLVAILCLVHEKDPLFPWQRVFFEVVLSGSARAIEFLCCQVAPSGPDLQCALVTAARRGRADIVELLCRQSAARDIGVESAVITAAEFGHRGIVELLCRQPYAQGMDLQSPLITAAQYGHRDIVDFLGRQSSAQGIGLQEAANVADTSTRGNALWAILDLYDKRTDPQASAFCPDEPLLSLRTPLERASAEDNFKRVVDIICRADESQIDLEAALAVAASPRVAEFLAKRMPARDTPPADPVSFDHWKFAID
ncbi:Ankyrin repeat domain containing protein [Pandoravirus macleodensis]|uniref:Ankyrin repeat domain containing protein n=1 Tax=Pandoravirus macleodensis TaxID=2107707 RepID=A0A2U7UFE2_9VIRU|nr:Ankyrin repeat domain containing protein [Pandoravirus macleodensis]AVK77198.1 Ankyrin repeat domain containing protein [Pandoravirus macleodensis]